MLTILLSTQKDHLVHLRIVLQRLKDSVLQSVRFFSTALRYVGSSDYDAVRTQQVSLISVALHRLPCGIIRHHASLLHYGIYSPTKYVHSLNEAQPQRNTMAHATAFFVFSVSN